MYHQPTRILLWVPLIIRLATLQELKNKSKRILVEVLLWLWVNLSLVFVSDCIMKLGIAMVTEKNTGYHSHLDRGNFQRGKLLTFYAADRMKKNTIAPGAGRWRYYATCSKLQFTEETHARGQDRTCLPTNRWSNDRSSKVTPPKTIGRHQMAEFDHQPSVCRLGLKFC